MSEYFTLPLIGECQIYLKVTDPEGNSSTVVGLYTAGEGLRGDLPHLKLGPVSKDELDRIPGDIDRSNVLDKPPSE